MKKSKVDTQRRKSLIKNFKALAFLSVFLLPLSLGSKGIAAKATGSDKKTTAVWG